MLAPVRNGGHDFAFRLSAHSYQHLPSLASYNRIAFYRFVTGDAVGAIDAMRLAIRAGSQEPENLAWCLTDLTIHLG